MNMYIYIGNIISPKTKIIKIDLFIIKSFLLLELLLF